MFKYILLYLLGLPLLYITPWELGVIIQGAAIIGFIRERYMS